MDVETASARGTRYRITVRGTLSERFEGTFAGMQLEAADGETALVGDVEDQSQLYGLLARLRDFGLELVRLEPEGATVSSVSEAPAKRASPNEPAPDDARLVAALRRGDEQAFARLIDRYHAALVRTASLYVREAAVAEEVAQETWLGVLHGIERFEGRSSLKTWIFRILTNKAKTRGERERRTIPISSLAVLEEREPAVDPRRFLDESHPEWPGHWAAPPTTWEDIPERRLQSKETLAQVRQAIEVLPPLQAQV
ncbi:MAG: sigma-70 family RNA polymerase sigma factor, partial [Actinomycetota bacterium]|nr:sigma-70 family RNA polymerase sigma factor [Actinomycetota bacterium]